MLNKMSMWKVAAPDQLFSIKHLTVLHEWMSRQLQGLLSRSEGIPKWPTTGRTSLTQKDVAKSRNQSNYRLMKCFPTTWKLLSRESLPIYFRDTWKAIDSCEHNEREWGQEDDGERNNCRWTNKSVDKVRREELTCQWRGLTTRKSTSQCRIRGY